MCWCIFVSSDLSSSVERLGGLPLLAVLAVLGPLLSHAVDVLQEVALHAIHYLGELKAESDF